MTSIASLCRSQPFLNDDIAADNDVLSGNFRENDAVAAAGIGVCLIALPGWLVGRLWFDLGFGLDVNPSAVSGVLHRAEERIIKAFVAEAKQIDGIDPSD